MQKYFFGLMILGVIAFFSACQKEDFNSSLSEIMELANASDKTSIEVSSVPEEISRFVAKKYSESTIAYAMVVNDKGHEIELGDGTQLYFGRKNRFLGDGEGIGRHGRKCMCGDSTSLEAVPQAIADYVATNYPDLIIEKVVTKRGGKLGVKLSDGVVLIFDAEGTFLKICDASAFHGGGNSCLKGDTLAVTDLALAISDYITATYPDLTIVKAVKKHGNKGFAVELSDGSILLFDEAGAYIKNC